MLPSKILIVVWRFAKDYVPTILNLSKRRVTLNGMCCQYGTGSESTLHVFCQCPTSIEVWWLVQLQWVVGKQENNCLDWFFWVFETGSELHQ